MDKPVRIDKWMWAVRIFKTRSLAAETCRKGRIFVNNEPAKPSRMVKPGDTIVWQRKTAVFTFRIIALTSKRVAARIASDYVEDKTPQAERDRLFMQRLPNMGYRKKGAGRPTKKERRIIDRFTNKD